MGRSWRYCLLMASTAISKVPDKIKTGVTFDVACVRIPMIVGVYMMIQKALEVSKSNFSSLQIQFIGFRFLMKMLAYSFMVWFFVLLCLL